MYRIFCIIPVLLLFGCRSHLDTDSFEAPRNRAVDISVLTGNLKKAEHLLVLDEQNLSPEEKLFVSTLQGLVSKSSRTQIYIDPGYGGYTAWLKDLEIRGVTVEPVDDYRILIDRYKDYIEAYILCSIKDQSVNGANSLVSLYKAPAIDTSLESEMISRGISMALDVRGKDEKWVFENYKDRFSKDVLFEQKESLVPALRDYAVALNGFLFFDGNSSFRKMITRWAGEDAPLFGWGDPGRGEDKFVAMSSRSDLYTIPSDHARNLSVFSGFETADLKQVSAEVQTYDEKVHYVSFLMSDGDNVQWMLGDLYTDSRWWGNSGRGSFPMGWAVSPLMADIAPSVLQRYYRDAAAGEQPNHFVAGPSGSGYLYPSLYSPQALAAHVETLNRRMGRTDLGIVEIIDFNSLYKENLWELYTRQNNIDALIYLEFRNHKSHKGKILWSKGKPIITPREMLWEGLRGCDEATVIRNLNGQNRNPSDSSGYSLVLVHAWSKGLDNVQQVIDGLDSDVKVVAPDELVRLITEKVSRD
ncbi:GxGYxYP domain-containing protein [Spirochaeta isovalerica]|uniref:GxGYxY sequence motif-containing protein n=1 Tax=Spirochaeta isovalerica TaxID=150 RepID=A0A841R7Z8_9SPIO|nr:GxGYxYP domain-containing protein [Spirochaeta isovalerica]MBB6479946.1 hypothetical protein [Spirochaeta isovalerica]